MWYITVDVHKNEKQHLKLIHSNIVTDFYAFLKL